MVLIFSEPEWAPASKLNMSMEVLATAHSIRGTTVTFAHSTHTVQLAMLRRAASAMPRGALSITKPYKLLLKND
jgi:hypothetical protein